MVEMLSTNPSAKVADIGFILKSNINNIKKHTELINIKVHSSKPKTIFIINNTNPYIYVLVYFQNCIKRLLEEY